MPKKTITVADIVRVFGECEIQDERGIWMPIIKPPEIDTYYSRTKNEDGTFEKEADRNNQKYVANIIKAKWKCEVLEYPRTSPIDYYITRDGRECFGDTKTATKVRTFGYLNIRKFCVLMDASRLWGCPSFFFLYDAEGVFYVDVREIGNEVKYEKGTAGSMIRKSPCDIEPAITIKKTLMKRLS